MIGSDLNKKEVLKSICPVSLRASSEGSAPKRPSKNVFSGTSSLESKMFVSSVGVSVCVASPNSFWAMTDWKLEFSCEIKSNANVLVEFESITLFGKPIARKASASSISARVARLPRALAM